MSTKKGFNNSLLPYGPDPWAACHDGFYYYTHSTRTNLTIWRTRDITDLANAEQKVVWNVPDDGPFSKNMWAPELHYLADGTGQMCWYAYLSAGEDRDAGDQRIWVLENEDCDPLGGEWQIKGELTTSANKWGIDGTIIDLNGQLYLSWSGWEADENGQQNIYLCRMRNPWTCIGERLLLSEPTLPWERHNHDPAPDSPHNHVFVNEAPAFLRHNDHLFIAYSASGCWTDEYTLGLLTARVDSDLMQPSSWTKAQEPVFKTSVRNRVYGPGHGCFFQTENGQTWFLYHANPGPGKGCENERTPRLQRVRWHRDGSPNFGVPSAETRKMERPV
ncbi:glycoside hydrolase family 43 protein [Fibrivirga algicola]|uniref:Family 43 glycosylhydrolase n=1 Tax=Fibrivirga algicola TaxID=2950420 RepID=A0ABX0QCV0_9BACT|nr:glycoside hydrolase family 43 protein [Fibrivirga algicola]NID10190.1 family 43 glycosylhydrolase [Fibrivirga algicola]